MPPRRAQAAPWLRAVRDLLHAHIEHPIGLAALAASVGVHPAHLARAFRQRYGRTPGTYLRAIRIEAAARLLLETRLPLGHVAAATGFYDQAHFTRQFRTQLGVTPRRYRDPAA